MARRVKPRVRPARSGPNWEPGRLPRAKGPGPEEEARPAAQVTQDWILGKAGRVSGVNMPKKNFAGIHSRALAGELQRLFWEGLLVKRCRKA